MKCNELPLMLSLRLTHTQFNIQTNKYKIVEIMKKKKKYCQPTKCTAAAALTVQYIYVNQKMGKKELNICGNRIDGKGKINKCLHTYVFFKRQHFI